MQRIICVSSELPRLAAENIAVALRNAISSRGKASLALAGGTTPRATYEALGRISGIYWSEVSVYFGDERAVPPDHPDSNYLMARHAFLDRLAIPETQVHRMPADAADRDAAARTYEATLPEELDVLVLGIGEDGHTASLFPGAPAVRERERRVLAVIGPKPPPQRLTITAKVISKARACFMLASGAGKAEAVVRALESDTPIEDCPAKLARGGTWLIDHAAAALLHP